ncbi:DUF3372 domain-containing protein [Alteromonas pelagimontana]|uniref:pullulanase n=1 Tax=Alteromonas pelagimontana TaxID=1858656 RepID=A0A6N3IX56_9ALTE|nr:alpha-1,6-glucosidase domain-containing protein [Alteromonas pelagimontana]QJR82932.1 DUF3372 domain-containing protein [Alteromonas pelagimontana]
MLSFKRTLALTALIYSILLLTACGGSEVESGDNDLLTCDAPEVPDAAGTSCVAPPPIACDPPTVPNEANDACVVGADPSLPDPVFFPGDQQAVLYFNRASVDADNSANDPAYEGWRLHTWNNDECDAYADADSDWANGRQPTGIDPNYGAYWVLELKENYGSCHNFIVHKGTDDAGKELGGGDFQGSLIQDDEKYTRMNFTLSGEATIFGFPIMSLGPQPVEIEGVAAHWLDTNTLLWNTPEGVESVKLHYSENATLTVTLEEGLNGTTIELVPASLSDDQVATAPHLAALAPWSGQWTPEEAKQLLTYQVVLAGYNSEGTLVAATGVQTAKALDALYTSEEDDADETQLGAIYTDTGITAAVWAPTAQSVTLLTYSDSKTLANSFTMTRDDTSGVWRYEGNMDLDRALYRYQVVVYHPATKTLETLEVTDPYSVSLTTNGRFSRFVNLQDEDLKPQGWETQAIPTIANPEDAVIYEGHIRDFSARDESTSPANRGKYLAFTEQGTAPVTHLQKLVEAGLTHFHILPSNDIATVDEDPANTVSLYNTVGDLCRLNGQAPICDEEPATSVLLDVYNSYDPLAEAEKAQALTQQIRGVDTFNWGYDPQHYSAPEGSYASDAEGVARIVEMRAMIQALHELGLRVALDVVFNHTSTSGVYPKSVLDKVVPGYYHRYDVQTGAIVQETCCEDTEPRNVMMEKVMKDSLLIWAQEYKFDAFRFDIMSQATKETMVRLKAAVQEVDSDTYFYGEGWLKEDRGYEQANQLNMAGTEIGTFNDRIREAVRQGNIFNPQSDQALSDQDRVKVGMAGTLTEFVLKTSNGAATATSNLGGYATDPADIINYVSKHDNETLWDQFNYTLPMDLSLSERVRAQNIGIGLPLMSQGIPFLQMGGDMLRSKSMDRNSYDSGDWFNYLDFTYNTNNWNVGLPLAEDNDVRWKEMGEFINSSQRAATMSDIEFASAVFNEFLSIRSQSPLFRLTTMQDVIDRVGFHNIGKSQQQGLIVMSIDDGVSPDSDITLTDIDPMLDALVVVVNTGYEEKSIKVSSATGFNLHPVQMNSVDANVRGAFFAEGEGDDAGNGTITVPALTMAVFVKSQAGAQGYGLSAYATSGAPDVVPFGDTAVFLRGDMNEWGTLNPMIYQGGGVYQVSLKMTAGTEYEFKVASDDYTAVNFGAPDSANVAIVEDEEKVLATSNNNLVFTPALSATYLFSFNAIDPASPQITIVNEEPLAGTTAFLRGDFNDWSTDNAFTYVGRGQYSATLSLAAGTYNFKAASDDWSTVNFGAISAAYVDKTVIIGGTTEVADTSENLQITVEEDAEYSFILNMSNAEQPVVKVFETAFFGTTPVFIRGGMNEWGTEHELVYQGSGIYSTEITLSKGATEFKVASEDWATIDFGTPEDAISNGIVANSAKVLGTSNINLFLDLPAGTYRFEVAGPDGSAPIVTVIPI